MHYGKKEFRAYGVRTLLSRHPEVRKLKRYRTPSAHGNQVWSSSWILMDYLARRGLDRGARVVEVGCGWGLLGIYCARRFGAKVTAIDVDPEVFPFLELHARANRVQMDTMQRGMQHLSRSQLEGVDCVVGADICFWDELARPLKKLVRRAIRADVAEVLIADPGRQPFYDVADHFAKQGRAELIEWSARRPRKRRGYILKVNAHGEKETA
mgnify:CR=1 FL=1